MRKIPMRWLVLGALLLLALALFFSISEVTLADNAHPVRFVGLIKSLPVSGLIGDWTIEGRYLSQQVISQTVTTHITTTTRIDQTMGAVKVGALVEVEGIAQADGSINAFLIRVLPDLSNGIPVKFFGIVDTLPASGLIGDWTIRIGLNEPITPTRTSNGHRLVTVHVTSATNIIQEEGQAKVGAFVKVEGWVLPDRTVIAREIEVKTPPPPPGLPVEFFGRIEQLPASGLIGDWTVSGRTVHVSAQTKIEHPEKAKVGAFVHVKGTALTDGTVNAREIEVRSDVPPTITPPVRYIRFYGIVQELPNTTGWIGDWKVNGLTIHVTAQTQVQQSNGAPAVGKPVEVKGILQNDGTVNALRIETKRPITTTNTFGSASAVSK
ncbi:MAG: hypothetical protein HY868_14385 [Chloroflexi bacterium]|nr:hypothetical protein [Chloroflexota bacterium]